MIVVETDTSVASMLRGWDHLDLWVGNARATAGFLMSAFGFRCTGYAGPETGVGDRASYVLEQGEIRLVVSAPLSATSPMALHVRAHGDGVRDLAWLVDDADAAWKAAVDRGARPVRAPRTESDQHGQVRLATVGTYGQTRHTFVDRGGYAASTFGPRYQTDNLPGEPAGEPVGLTSVDHVVGNVEDGRLEHWVRFYEDVMGFAELAHFDESQISTKYSALRSTVVWNRAGIVMPINEPAEGLKKSQIQEYLDAYDGPGVQHIAMGTEDIVTTVRRLRARGVRFMHVPDSYYVEARARLAGVSLPWADLEELNILVDRDADGHLLQIFTETVSDRPTLFFEIIQRCGARGFGEGNFKALFEAIERDQARRGNL
jgi:4-hydroxyphenylpyruvate dioxygenase